jgi:serine/threonine protein phosphatase PrpC
MDENKNGVRLDVGALSDIGRKRRKNEDNLAVYTLDGEEDSPVRDGGLFMVADGLGGHVGGDVASKLAVKIMGDYFLKVKDAPNEPMQRLVFMVEKANRHINNTGARLIQDKPAMATTLSAVLVQNDKAVVANVGDSRTYLVRDGQIRQISVDNSWVQEQVDQGFMTPEDARLDKRRNLVTRTLGTQKQVYVDVYEEQLLPDDRLVLCTDGLCGYVRDEAILAQVLGADTAQEATDGLIRIANEKGGRDNITAIVVWFNRPWKEAAGARLRKIFSESWPHLVRLIVLLGLIGAAFFAGYLLRR